jgi:hypothetical protein
MTRFETEDVKLEPCSSCQKTEYLFDNLFYDTQKYEVTEVTLEMEEYKCET